MPACNNGQLPADINGTGKYQGMQQFRMRVTDIGSFP